MSEALKRARAELDDHKAKRLALATEVHRLCPSPILRSQVDEVLDALWLIGVDLNAREQK